MMPNKSANTELQLQNEGLGRVFGVRSFIHVFRSSFAHSEQSDWQNIKPIKSGSKATNTCANSCYFNSNSLPAYRY